MTATDAAREFYDDEGPSDAVLALVAKHSHAGVVITDEDERVVFVNEAFVRISGYTFAEMVGKRPGPMLQGPATDPTARHALRTAIRQRVPVTTDIVNYHKDGTPYWVEISLVPVPGASPGAGRIIAIEQDVSARRESAARLASRESELRSVFESITDHAVFLLDLRGIVQRVNAAATVLTGWPTTALKGRPVWELKSGRGMRVRFQQQLRAAAIAKRVGTSRLIRRNGEYYWAKWSLTPLRAEDGGIDGFVLIAHDVTSERRAARARESARSHAEEIARSKSTFLANMSHEIRTPLNGVLGLARLLLDEPLSDNQRRLASTLLGSGEALLTVVNDVLDFSKLEAGKMTLAPVPTALAEVVRGVVSILDVGARNKGLRLGATIADNVPPYVLVDAGRLRQVLLNLAGNAVKFTDSGRVTIDVTAERCTETDVSLALAVADTGIGIAADDLDRLFRTFEQVDASTARRATGTGLGLAISKSIADLMHGRIDVQSTVGEGSCFTLRMTVPLAAPIESAPEREHKPRRFAGRRILVAEDNPVNQMVAKLMLERFGCVVRIAADGDDALTYLSTETWDLVLMDGSMPSLDGYEVTRRLREREAMTGTRTPVVACSASAFPEDRRRALDAGMDDTLPKPIAPESLIRILETWLPESESVEAVSDVVVPSRMPRLVRAALLDPVRLESLRLLDESGRAIAKITDAFVNSVPQRLQTLRDALSRGDRATVERTAHGLRGSAAQLG
ncbi:MAG: PAS domain S-box protein, partial [Gemmatimonadaceae bacterium]|nr:PAS domain S-box protein [Gemmatimonadaceae bacterium]